MIRVWWFAVSEFCHPCPECLKPLLVLPPLKAPDNTTKDAKELRQFPPLWTDSTNRMCSAAEPGAFGGEDSSFRFLFTSVFTCKTKEQWQALSTTSWMSEPMMAWHIVTLDGKVQDHYSMNSTVGLLGAVTNSTHSSLQILYTVFGMRCETGERS